MYVEQDDIARIVAREELTLEDVKILIRGVRYHRGQDERFHYADSLLSEARVFLPAPTLSALLRAEISVQDAAIDLERNRKVFSRLVILLPSLIRFSTKKHDTETHGELFPQLMIAITTFTRLGSRRKDRQLREAKERIVKASNLASEAALAIANAKRHFEIEFDRYRAAYYKPSIGPSRFLSDLIDELQVCSGVLEIVNEIADVQPQRLFVFGNDARSSVVEWAYRMCTMWNGPPLVTTPGSDFAALCSLLFEAVSGRSDEGLAGAIIRYARSDSRKRWDREGMEEEDSDEDNFQSEKRAMIASSKEAELCKSLLRSSALSEMSKVLLHMRIKYEQQKYTAAENAYGPRQVYITQMNAEQWNNMLMEAVDGLKPEQFEILDQRMSSGKSLAALDIELGQLRRAKGPKIDI